MKQETKSPGIILDNKLSQKSNHANRIKKAQKALYWLVTVQWVNNRVFHSLEQNSCKQQPICGVHKRTLSRMYTFAEHKWHGQFSAVSLGLCRNCTITRCQRNNLFGVDQSHISWSQNRSDPTRQVMSTK